MKNISVYNKMTNSERKVAKLLKKIGIKWSYEHPVFVWDENKRPRVWAPDFYLSQFGIYIEVCGSDCFNYEYRRKIFKENNVNVIFLHVYKNELKWKNYFFIYLNKIITNWFNKYDEIKIKKI